MSEENKKIIELAEKAKAGDKDSMNQLVNHFYQAIFMMVFYRTGSKPESEDLTQDIFMKMIKNIKNIRDTSLFKGWLYKIAVNKINDYYRKKSLLSLFVSNREPEYLSLTLNENQINDENPSKTLLKKEFYTALFGFTNKLGKREKEVFLLRFIDQLNIKEIAEAINKNESTVKTHLYRAIKKFRNNKGLNSITGGYYER